MSKKKRFYFHADTKKKCAAFYDATGIKFSLSMSGKMDGVLSISTNCKYNARCIRNMTIPGSICGKCFAHKTVDHYDALSINTRNNLDKLTAAIIPADIWPTFDPADLDYMIRIESFGDVQNAIQAINYMNLAAANPECVVTAWTKNPDIWETAIKLRKGGKPANMNLIFSAMFIDKPATFDKIRYWFFDKSFTVYSKEYAASQGENFINCGARSCRDCKRCYTLGGDFENVREQVK